MNDSVPGCKQVVDFRSAVDYSKKINLFHRVENVGEINGGACKAVIKLGKPGKIKIIHKIFF